MGEERRKCYRYPPAGGSESAVLRHEGVDRAAKLVNFSAGGFRVDLEGEFNVEVGDVLILATSNGFHRASVANVSREGDILRLGLRRVADLPPKVVEEMFEGQTRKTEKKRTRRLSFSSPLLQVCILALIGMLILAAVRLSDSADVDSVVAPDDSNGIVPPSDPSARRRARISTSADRVSSTDVRKEKTSRTKVEPSTTSQTRGAKNVSWTAGPSTSDDSDKKSMQLSYGRSSLSSPTGSSRSDGLPFAETGRRDATDGGASGGSYFDPRADASLNIAAALKTANRENKRVLLQFGGNECGSCNRLYDAFTRDSEIASTFEKAFVLVLVDIDANQKLVTRYLSGGFERHVPFLALLDKNGNVLKQQRADDFEVGSKLETGKLKEFLRRWSSAT